MKIEAGGEMRKRDEKQREREANEAQAEAHFDRRCRRLE